MSHPLIAVRRADCTTLHLQIREPLEIGRECNGLLLDDPAISRRHLRLQPESGGGVSVEDLGSTNGTIVDGQPATMPMLARPGSSIELGGVRIEVLPPPDAAVNTRATAGGAGAPPRHDATIAAGVVRPVSGNVGRETSIDKVVASIPDIAAMKAPLSDDEGTITIVFSDVEEGTKAAIRLGDEFWFQSLTKHHEIIRRRVAEAGGTEVENQGDGFMLTFPGARRAVRAMAAVQQDLARWAVDDPERALKVRIGMHTGEVIAHKGNLFGQHVIKAARIANHADGGDLYISSLTKEMVASRGDIPMADPLDLELKGIEGPHFVYPVLWDRVEL